jgi:hypothetical protein
MRYVDACLMSFGILSALLLASCSDMQEAGRRYEDRWGPDPKMPANAFTEIAQQQKAVMASIVAAYEAVPTADGVTKISLPMPDTETNFWLKVTTFGMNVIDQKCDVYMSDLFKLNRERNRNDSILKSMQAASTAIVGVSVAANKAKIPLLSIASAFGLVESINDEASKTYLFEQIPGIVADKVRQARNLYRQRTVPLLSNSRTLTSPIYDEATAYRALRDYLSLCLPQTIEGNFLQTYIASSPTVKVAASDGSVKPVVAEPKKAAAAPPAAETDTPATSLNFTITQ